MHRTLKSVRLQHGELARVRAFLRDEQDFSHLLDHRRFERLDLHSNLRIEDALAAIAAADITGVSKDAVARALRDVSLVGCVIA